MSNLFSSNINEVYPFLSQNPNILLESLENKKYCFRNPKLPKPLIFNEATYMILSYCDGENSIKDILDTESSLFPDAEYEKIKKDIINILYPLWKLKIIMFKKGILPFDGYLNKAISEKLEFRVEYNPSEIVRILNDKETGTVCEDNYTMTKADLNISFMYNNQLFFSLIDDGCRIITLNLIPYCICQPYTDILYFNTDYIFISKDYNFSKDLINDFIMWCIDFYNHETKMKSVKSCIYLYFKCSNNIYTEKKAVLNKIFSNGEEQNANFQDEVIILEKKITKGNSTR